MGEINQALYLKLRLSLTSRDTEEIAKERGLRVEQAIIQRWIIKDKPALEQSFKRKKTSVRDSIHSF